MSEAEPSILALEDCKEADKLAELLSTLFEPSPALHALLVPSVLLRLTSRAEPPASYAELIDICADVAKTWTWDQKADFISGHPVIGEVKGLSKLSGKEQGGVTRAVVLDRLSHLNKMYSVVYPGLRYITFVNGRTRAAIVPEFEAAIGLEVSPEPLPDNFTTAEPALESEVVLSLVHEPESQAWKVECDRALKDVWRIGHARLGGLGLV